MGEKETVVTLAAPRKKGLLRLVFNRLFLIAVLIVLQIVLVVAVYLRFREYIPHFAVLQLVFMGVMVLYLINNGMDSSAKLTWLMMIALLPIPGTVFLAYTRTNLGHRLLKRRVEQTIAETKNAIPQDETLLEELAKMRTT